MNAVDTNIYAYALDADEPAKQGKALDLLDRLMLQRDETVLVWQVAAEFLGQLRKWQSKGRLTLAEVEAAFHRARSMFTIRTPSEALSNFLRSPVPI
jgi:predicted nucleic acid-binding protein